MSLIPFSLLGKVINKPGAAKTLQDRFAELKAENEALQAKLATREEEFGVLWRENEKLRKRIEPLEAEVQRARSMISAEWGELCDEETNILVATVQHSDHSHAELASLYHVTEAQMALVLDDLRVKGLVGYDSCPTGRRAWRTTTKGLKYLADRGLLP